MDTVWHSISRLTGDLVMSSGRKCVAQEPTGTQNHHPERPIRDFVRRVLITRPLVFRSSPKAGPTTYQRGQCLSVCFHAHPSPDR